MLILDFIGEHPIFTIIALIVVCDSIVEVVRAITGCKKKDSDVFEEDDKL